MGRAGWSLARLRLVGGVREAGVQLRKGAVHVLGTMPVVVNDVSKEGLLPAVADVAVQGLFSALNSSIQI